jgi:hypothetical protein
MDLLERLAPHGAGAVCDVGGEVTLPAQREPKTRELLIQPLPWTPVNYGDGLWCIEDANAVIVLGHVTQDEAEMICRSVNSYPALVAALQEMLGLFDPEGLPEDDAVFQAYHKAQAALQQAGIAEG